MKHFKIAVLAGVIIVALIFLFPYIQQALPIKAEGGFIKNQTDIISESSGKEIYCNDAGIQVNSVKYDNSNKKLSASIKNTGNVSLYSIKFMVLLKNGSGSKYNSTPQEDLGYKETKDYFALIENGCDIDSVVITSNCPSNARKEITNSDNKFTFIGC